MNFEDLTENDLSIELEYIDACGVVQTVEVPAALSTPLVCCVLREAKQHY